MLATTPLFYSNDWPKRLINHLTKLKYQSKLQIVNQSSHCVYDKIKTDGEKKSTKLTLYHKAFTVFTLFYITEQAILPFSHSITKVSLFV